MRGISLITIHIIFFGCFSCTRLVTVPDKDAGQDTVEDIDAFEDTGAPESVQDAADDLDVEEEADCGGPEGDCDGDGISPIGGDCCDDERLAHPGQDNWFAVPYYCPDESWDYDCDGDVQYEYSATSTLPIDCSGLSRTICEDTRGWYDEVPECGSIGRFVYCIWSTYSGSCVTRTDDYEGLVRCR